MIVFPSFPTSIPYPLPPLLPVPNKPCAFCGRLAPCLLTYCLFVCLFGVLVLRTTRKRELRPGSTDGLIKENRRAFSFSCHIHTKNRVIFAMYTRGELEREGGGVCDENLSWTHTPLAHTHTPPPHHTHTHTQTHIHTHADTHAHTHTNTHAHVRTKTRTHIHTHTHTLSGFRTSQVTSQCMVWQYETVCVCVCG